MNTEPKPPTAASRVMVPALDAILGAEFKALDKGFIRVVDYMGSDASIVQAARVSYGHGTKQLREDRGLIRYLMRHQHTTPFEMCELKLHVRVPMDTWRQWIRHRTASVNEYSTRYSIAIDDAQHTSADAWRLQSTTNRQGSGEMLPTSLGSILTTEESELQKRARDVYEHRLASGVAREQARKDLPLSTYTEAYWKCDLHNLFHFLMLRMSDHAQLEVRTYARIIGHEIIARWCPMAWEAFVDYRLNRIDLAAPEIKVLSVLLSQGASAGRQAAIEALFLDATTGRITREGKEFESKLAALGLEGLSKNE
jgi:thymidylate synthase (FAD)